MDLYINSANKTIISDPQFRTPLNTITFKRGDAAEIKIKFYDNNGVLQDIVADREIEFGIKASGKYDGDFLVYTDTVSMLSATNEYVISPSFNTTALNSLLSSGDGNPNNDVASVNTMMELTWSDDGGTSWLSTDTITAVINNDVIKGSEGTPLETASPAEWLIGTGLPLNYTTTTSMVVSGSGSSILNGTYALSGSLNGKDRWQKFDDPITEIVWDNVFWRIEKNDGLSVYASYISNEDVLWPSLVTTWVEGISEMPLPMPTVNFEEIPTTPAPPYFRVHNDKFYFINQNGFWMSVDGTIVVS